MNLIQSYLFSFYFVAYVIGVFPKTILLGVISIVHYMKKPDKLGEVNQPLKQQNYPKSPSMD